MRIVGAWRRVAEAIGAKGAARAAAREEAQALASAESAVAQAEAQLVGGLGSSPFSAEREVRRDNVGSGRRMMFRGSVLSRCGRHRKRQHALSV
eukprot:4871862-Prymnesium_polylepis.1